MNEAHQIYDNLLEALEPILPRTIYQDVRRVRTLAWAITGLCLTQTVRLGAWAQVLEGRAQYAASRVRRFARWLHHPAISPAQWYKPVLQAALVDWPAKTRLYVALDTTALTPFVLIRASLVYRGRAIPLAWRAMRHRSTQVSFEAYQPVLNQVCAPMPAGQVITLLADRGFVHEQLLHSPLEAWVALSLALASRHPDLSLDSACFCYQGSVSTCWTEAILPEGINSRSSRRASLSGSGLPP